MALINYVEPVNMSAVVIAFGSLILTLVLAYFFYKVFKTMSLWLEMLYNHSSKYIILEEKMLDSVAEEKGINLDAELMKRNMIAKPSKSFTKRVQDQMYEKMFGEEEKKK